MLHLTACRQMTEVAEADEVMVCKLLLKVAMVDQTFTKTHFCDLELLVSGAPEQEAGRRC